MKNVAGALLFGPNDASSGGKVENEYELTELTENDGEGPSRRLKYSGDGSGFLDADQDYEVDAEESEDDSAASRSENDEDRGGEDSWEDEEHQPVAPDNDAAGEQCGSPQPQTPSSTYVAGMALDLLSSILVSLFFFTLSSAEGGTYIDGLGDNHGSNDDIPFWSKSWSKMAMASARLAAPVFPLLLFLYCTLRAALPLRRRKTFWAVVSRTPWAPYCDVTFRDGFIGDILTSTVRPLQDVAFTTFYILSGLQGWWTATYSIDEAAGPVERSWVVHTVILPACVVSPLWWRFLQNMRQTYDEKKRWPYLGNALKYFLAAEVALFGLFEPDAKQNVLWIGCFVLATLYQVWWDVFMDWELLEYRDGAYRLRSKRLYSRRSMYFGIFTVNFVLRFCWTMTLIPRRYLSESGMLKDAYSSDFQTFIGPALASAEIIRRSLWGLLRVEWEAIKTSSERESSGTEKDADHEANSYDMNDEEELEPMRIGDGHSTGGRRRGGGLSFPGMDPILEPYFGIARREMSSMTELQILGELCLYATAFTSLGIFAAAHRHVL